MEETLGTIKILIVYSTAQSPYNEELTVMTGARERERYTHPPYSDFLCNVVNNYVWQKKGNLLYAFF